MDSAVAGFQFRTGLSCPEGCGHCCSSQKVEATVLECIPLAFELFRTLQAELILKRLEKNEDDRRCVLYRADFTAAGLWGCTQYSHRAVVCRMFGFAGNRDRQGIPRLAMCRVMKEKDKEGEEGIECDDPNTPMPLFVDAGLQITTLHPDLGTRRMPINSALQQALLKVGMMLDLAAPNLPATPNNDEQPGDQAAFAGGDYEKTSLLGNALTKEASLTETPLIQCA